MALIEESLFDWEPDLNVPTEDECQPVSVVQLAGETFDPFLDYFPEYDIQEYTEPTLCEIWAESQSHSIDSSTSDSPSKASKQASSAK